MPQNATVAGAEWSPDGTRIATRSSDSTASIWDARSSRRLVGPLHHDGSVSYVAWSPDGSRLALAGTTAATLWNASTGARVAILSDPTGAELPAWSPDGRQLATPVYDGTVRISDGASGAPIGAPLRHGYRWVISVAWSHDGRRLATGSYFGHFARIWDGATRRPLLELRTDDKVGQVAWSADDRWLATVDRYSGRLVLWDLAAPSAGTR